MNKNTQSWIILFIASLFEVAWAIMLGKIGSVFDFLITAICIIFSFWGLIVASNRIPTGTAYALFVGIGCIGTTLVSVLFFGEAFSPQKIFFIALLLISVIGLKITSKEVEE
ncbi:DMT family transporter [Peptostreptococcus faecalis]|uniref:DMT family transporter n=1 Tax=Peptostreptococcus faecalis TaxID=2045015 RepID=UPI000C7CDF91|nr:multidrug efflux SMR transporter [Peptostreptococcus faecalis]